MQITKLAVWINRLDANVISARIKMGLNARLIASADPQANVVSMNLSDSWLISSSVNPIRSQLFR